MSEPKPIENSLDKTNIVSVETNGIGDLQPTENEKSREDVWSSGSSWDEICNGKLSSSIVEIVQKCTPLPQRSGGRKRSVEAQYGEPLTASRIPIIFPKINKSTETKSEPGSPAHIPKYVNSKIPIINTPEKTVCTSSEATPVKTRSSSLGRIPKKTTYSVTKTIPKRTSFSAMDTTLKKSVSTLSNSTPEKISGTCNGAIQEVHSSVNGTIPKRTGIVPRKTGTIPEKNGIIPKNTGTIPKENGIIPDTTRTIPMETEAIPKNTGTKPKENGIIPDTTATMPKETEAIPKKIEAIPKNTGTIPEENGVIPKKTGTIPKGNGIMSKKTGTIPKKTGTIPKENGIIRDTTGTIPKETEAISKKTEAIPKNTGTIPTENGIIPDTTGTIPKETEAIPKKTEAIPKNTWTTPEENGVIPKKTGTIPKGNGIMSKKTGTIPKKTAAIPKNTEIKPKENNICVTPNGTIQKKAHSSVTEDTPKKTGIMPKKPGTTPKKPYSTATETTPKNSLCDVKVNDCLLPSSLEGYFPSNANKDRKVEETEETILPKELQYSEYSFCGQSETEDLFKIFWQEIPSIEIQKSVPVSQLDKIEEILDNFENSKMDAVVSRSMFSSQWDATLFSETVREEAHITQKENKKYSSQFSDSRSMSSSQWDSTLSSETMVEKLHIRQKEDTEPRSLNEPPIMLKPKKSSKWFRSKLPKPTEEFRQKVEAQTDLGDVINLVHLTVEELMKINAAPDYEKIQRLTKRNVRFTDILDSYDTEDSDVQDSDFGTMKTDTVISKTRTETRSDITVDCCSLLTVNAAPDYEKIQRLTKRNVRFTDILDSYDREESDVQDSDFGTMETDTVISETRTETRSDITVDCCSYMTADSGEDTMDTFSEMRDDNPDDWEDFEEENDDDEGEWELVTTGLSKQKLKDICSYIHCEADKDVDSTVSLSTIETCPQEEDKNLEETFHEFAIKDKHLPRDQKSDRSSIKTPENQSNDQTSKVPDEQLLDDLNLEQQLHDVIDEDQQKSESPTSNVEQQKLVTGYQRPSVSKIEQHKFIPYCNIPFDQQKVDYQTPSSSKVQLGQSSTSSGLDLNHDISAFREEIPSLPPKPKRKVSFNDTVLKIDAPVFKSMMFPNSNESAASTTSTNDARPENSQTSSTSSLQSGSTGEYPQAYSISCEDKLRKMKEIIALSAFKGKEPLNLNIRPDLIREKISRAEELKKLIEEEKKVDDGSTRTIEIDGQTIIINLPPKRKFRAHSPEWRNILETIDRVEDFLEIVLTIGFKISRGILDKFERQQVPTPIHNAMCDVRSFTLPIKQQLKIAIEFGDGVFFKPLADSVNFTINSAFNHLNDSLIALESPATLKYSQLESEPERPATNYWDRNPSNILQNFEPQPQQTFDFMTQTMNQFFKMNRFRMMSPMERGRINPNGLVEIPFQYDIYVGVTLDLGLMLMSQENKIFIALSADEVLAGMRFRYGEIFQKNEFIEFSCCNGFGEVAKRARFSDKGVSFQDEMSPLTYLITPAGISTCQPIISCIVPDSIATIFYSGSRVGEQFTPECVDLLQLSRFEFHPDDSMNWIIKNVRIKQTTDGQVVIHKKNAIYTLVITPRLHEGNELGVSSRLTTPSIHVTSSVQIRDQGNKFHMYARQHGKKVYYSDQKFVCRNNTQSAGIDANHLICLDPN